jgi:NADH-quinone oxidoreductase subunit M
MPGAIQGLLDQNLLSVIVFLPIASLLPLVALQAVGVRVSDRAWKIVAFAASIVGFALSVHLWSRFDSTSGGMQLVEYVPWISDYGISYYLGVDGLSLFLLVLTSFLLPVILLACWNDIEQRVKSFVLFMMALQTGMLGAFVSLNLFLFYVFWEVMLIPMYFVIGIWGGPRRLYATLKFFIYTMLGSLPMLVGILVLVYLHQQQAGALTFDYIGYAGASGILDTQIAADGGPWWARQSWLFAAFALAFAIKVPVFPFHTWLPDAHVEAPTPGSAVLAGVLLKLGTYGFVRFSLPLFPQAVQDLAPWMLGIACAGIVYGALVAMVQTDVKKLVAYSSVSHMGFVMLGIFALNSQGLQGAILQMVNHGISTGALFILIGMIYERRHTREFSSFGGLTRVMPVYAFFWVLTVMSSAGLPALNGFVGEFLILLGTFGANALAAVVATSGVILGAVYLLWATRRMFFGPLLHDANRALVDLDLREKVVACALAVPMVWIGVYPASFLDPMDATVNEILQTMERRGESAAAPAAAPQAIARVGDPSAALSEESGE